MGTLLERLFGCAHSRYTWPQKDKKTGKTTVSCLDCGKTLPYDFDKLGGEEEIITPRKTAPKVQVIDTPEKAAAFTQGVL